MYRVNGHKHMLTIKMTTLYILIAITVFRYMQNEAVLILIPGGYTLFLVHRPSHLITPLLLTVYAHDHTNLYISSVSNCSII